MSRLAKKPITIPEKTEVTQNGTVITVKGPKGELSKNFSRPNVIIEIKDEKLHFFQGSFAEYADKS